ncbi:MAG: isochorismatase family protein [Rhodospirillales bacterium]|jgi:nicotinamidase-related amidase/catechol 2,3-dioxygenase-like lactoylglutathione lyase family enzyme|nr:isochorismatase family protein [Rhodospirillales bacterium]HJO72442.1 isochorismatase family protein [Rhodospirillales bacterium]
MSLDLLDPANSALLVIDMQNGFCHERGTLGVSGVNIKPAIKAIPVVKSLVKSFRAAGLPVLWTVQEHFATDAKRDRKRLPSHTAKRKKVASLAGTWDARLVRELAPLADDPALIIYKHRFGAFYETRLQQMLEMLGVGALFVCGTTANACVETTLREAYLRDYDVVAVTDAIAGINRAWEKTAQEVWQQYLCALTKSKKVAGWLDAKTRPAPLGLAHMLLQVSDMKRAKRFYVDILGFEVKPDAVPLADGRPLIVTKQGLGLTGGGPGDSKQLDHFAFEVRGVAELAARARKAKVPVVRKLGPGAYGLTIYLADPDGNTVELFEVVD